MARGGNKKKASAQTSQSQSSESSQNSSFPVSLLSHLPWVKHIWHTLSREERLIVLDVESQDIGLFLEERGMWSMGANLELNEFLNQTDFITPLRRSFADAMDQQMEIIDFPYIQDPILQIMPAIIFKAFENRLHLMYISKRFAYRILLWSEFYIWFLSDFGWILSAFAGILVPFICLSGKFNLSEYRQAIFKPFHDSDPYRMDSYFESACISFLSFSLGGWLDRSYYFLLAVFSIAPVVVILVEKKFVSDIDMKIISYIRSGFCSLSGIGLIYLLWPSWICTILGFYLCFPQLSSWLFRAFTIFVAFACAGVIAAQEFFRPAFFKSMTLIFNVVLIILTSLYLYFFVYGTSSWYYTLFLFTCALIALAPPVVLSLIAGLMVLIQDKFIDVLFDPIQFIPMFMSLSLLGSVIVFAALKLLYYRFRKWRNPEFVIPEQTEQDN